MIIISKFDIGDVVKCGPIDDGVVTGIVYGSTITYTVTYWNDRTSNTYTAWEWELTLIERSTLDLQGKM